MDTAVLDPIVTAYVQPMTSVRGRRVHRLLMREFSRFDRVTPLATETGVPALVASADDGSMAICRTDGRGPSAAIVVFPPAGPPVMTVYDLLKDSLPAVRTAT